MTDMKTQLMNKVDRDALEQVDVTLTIHYLSSPRSSDIIRRGKAYVKGFRPWAGYLERLDISARRGSMMVTLTAEDGEQLSIDALPRGLSDAIEAKGLKSESILLTLIGKPV
jgi:hypothetical protein